MTTVSWVISNYSAKVQGKHREGDVDLCEKCGEPIHVWKTIVSSDGSKLFVPCWEPCKCDKEAEHRANSMQGIQVRRAEKWIGRILGNFGGFIRDDDHCCSFCEQWESHYVKNPEQYTRSGIGAYLYGSGGSGKTSALRKALVSFDACGSKVAYIKHKDIIELYQAAMNPGAGITSLQITASLNACDVLAIDDFASCYLSEWVLVKTVEILKDAADGKTLLCIASKHDQESLSLAMSKFKPRADEIIEILSTKTEAYRL